MKYLATSLLASLSFIANTSAVRISGRSHILEGRDGANVDRGVLGKRASIAAPDLSNMGDLKYFTNISMNNEEFPVLIDTGSSDLYLTGSVAGAGTTGKNAKVGYAIGSASGPVLTAKLDFEGFTVVNQAFILDTSGNNEKNQGLIGLGPSSNSEIRQALGSPAGDPPLDRIFRQNTSTPNYITIYLGRSDDPTDPFPGDLTVGSLVPGYENVTTMPKLPIAEVKSSGGQHWQTMLDEDGIIGPDGQVVKVQSKVKGSNKKRPTVVLDSGFSLSQVTKSVADAFYGRVPGAKLDNLTGIGTVYTLPCDVELNVTFKLGGISYPIHPLDMNIASLSRKDSLGNPICIGAFQPIMSSAQGATYDMILGMSFLRNAYMLINFGDFVAGSSSNTADPYVQLLPLTDSAAEAHLDFVNVRQNGIDNTDEFHLLPASVLPPTETDNSHEQSLGEKIKPYIPYIIAGSVAAGVILLIAISFCIFSSRKTKYRKLEEPAPQGMHQYHQDLPFTQYQPSRRY